MGERLWIWGGAAGVEVGGQSKQRQDVFVDGRERGDMVMHCVRQHDHRAGEVLEGGDDSFRGGGPRGLAAGGGIGAGGRLPAALSPGTGVLGVFGARAADPVFGLATPTEIPGVPRNVLRPLDTWKDQAAYSSARSLLSVNFELPPTMNVCPAAKGGAKM